MIKYTFIHIYINLVKSPPGSSTEYFFEYLSIS